MKYAVTGHTQGIGQGLYKRLGADVIGFSTSTGYDINDPKLRFKIAKEAAECDVFINNAAPATGLGQTYMLIEMVKLWAGNPDKKIINVGSRVASIKVPANRLELLNYQAEKLALKSMCDMLQGTVKCQIVYKTFAYVGTEKILAKYPHFTPADYITVDQAVDIILSDK